MAKTQRSTLLTLFLLLCLFNMPALGQNEETPAPSPTEAPADSPSNSPSNPPTYQQSLLDRQVAEHEKALLNVAGQQHLAFYLSETTGTAHGGLILLPDLGRHPASNGTINTLRQSLASHHWHTLALNSSQLSDKSSQQLIDAAVLYLNQQGVFNIAILGEGVGAAQALHYAANLPPINPEQELNYQIRALLMINANNRIPNSDINILKQLSTITLPVLDAYSSSDYFEQQLAKDRKRSANRLMKGKKYQQIRLPQTNGSKQGLDNRISKRIRGWLDNNVAGFMVDTL